MPDDDRPSKEPWLAVSLSWLVAGLGQFYAGTWVWGLVFLSVWLGLQAGASWHLGAANGRLLWGAVLILAALLLWLANVVHTFFAARRRNAPAAEQERRRAKDPFLAVFLTLVVPGVGHLYLRRWLAGVGLVVGTGILLFTSPALAELAGLEAGLVVHAVVLSVYEAGAALLAYRTGRPGPRRRPGGMAAVCLLTMVLGVFPMAAALVLREHVVEAFRVPTASMAPTLQPDDHVLAWKLSYEPARGDLVVHHLPGRPDTSHIKRLAALPGETIEVRPDGVYVDGMLLTEPPFGQMGGISPPPHHADPTWATEGDPFTVPKGHVFVLGDNIAESSDSRHFGPVPLESIVGRAYKRYWPPAREGPIE